MTLVGIELCSMMVYPNQGLHSSMASRGCPGRSQRAVRGDEGRAGTPEARGSSAEEAATKAYEVPLQDVMCVGCDGV